MNSWTIKYFFFKILHKTLPFKFREAFVALSAGRCRIDTSEPQQLKALDFFHHLHPDCGGSCIAENEPEIIMNPGFDLHIIVPVYNVEQYLSECLDSIFAQQTKYRFFVTAVNDGSPDNSRAILSRYEGRENFEVIDQANRGLSGARNAALRHIKGRYVAFVDSDDLLTPGAIENWLDAAYEHDADIVQGGFVSFNKDGIHSKSSATRAFAEGEDAGNVVRLRGLAWGKVYKAHLWHNVQFPEKYWFEDTVCHLVIHRLAQRRASINNFVYKYRSNPQGITSRSIGNPKILDSFYIISRLLYDCDRRFFISPAHAEAYCGILTRIDFNRIATLRREDVLKNLFILRCGLWNKFFVPRNLHSKSYTKIEQAYVSGNYRLWKLATLLLID